MREDNPQGLPSLFVFSTIVAGLSPSVRSFIVITLRSGLIRIRQYGMVSQPCGRGLIFNTGLEIIRPDGAFCNEPCVLVMGE